MIYLHLCIDVEKADYGAPEELVDWVMRVGTKAKIRFYPTGSGETAEHLDENIGSMTTLFLEKGIPTLGIGPTCGLTHGRNELIHGGDLYWARNLCMEIMKSRIKY